MKRIALILATLTLVGSLSRGGLVGYAATETAPDKFVRTANYYLLSGSALDSAEARRVLPKFDILVLPVEAQVFNRDFFAHARRVNPDIIILAYVVSTSWNDLYWNDSLHARMRQGIQDGWWLTNGFGSRTSNWPGLTLLNLNTPWTDYLARFTADEILGTGLWDGVFYDDVGDGVSWVGNVDVDRNGSPDSSTAADTLWRAGYVRLASETRNRVGDQYLILTNGSSRAELAPHVNGRMFEAFPTPWEGHWNGTMQKYLTDETRVRTPQVHIINGGTENTGTFTDYQKVRYGLTSTLLGNGYFGFDFGTTRHNDLWYYDEYDADLGAPINGPSDVLRPGTWPIKQSVWTRDFVGGKVLVNATETDERVRLNGEYEHLRGTQDPTINSGRIVSSVHVGAKDGVILLRTVENITGATYINGSFVRVFNELGTVERNGFFAYNDKAQGSENVITYDTDMDGKLETVVAGRSRVDIYDDDGSLHASFSPYTDRYRLGVNLAIADIENDGSVEIVTGTEDGGGPQLRIFNKDGNLIHPGFFAYDTAFRGGVNVASADVNGDGIDDIITGPGAPGGPHVRVFDRDGHLFSEFFAFETNRTNGVEVLATDVDRDGRAEIMGMSEDIFIF